MTNTEVRRPLAPAQLDSGILLQTDHLQRQSGFELAGTTGLGDMHTVFQCVYGNTNDFITGACRIRLEGACVH